MGFPYDRAGTLRISRRLGCVAIEQRKKLRSRERFLRGAIGAELHCRLQEIVPSAQSAAGHHNDTRPRIYVFYFQESLDTVLIRHKHVEQNALDNLPAKQRQRHFATACDNHPITGGLKNLPVCRDYERLIVGD
jgi:hypothetical protein